MWLYWQDREKPSFAGRLPDDLRDIDCFIQGVQDGSSIPIEDGVSSYWMDISTCFAVL